MFKDKRGVVGQAVDGAQGLVIKVVVALLIVGTIVGAGLLTANSSEYNATQRLSGNFTSGIDNVSSKIPTLFTIAIIVVVLFFIALLIRNTRTQGGGSL